MAAGLTIAVVGVTGAVGQTTLKILDERKFPVRELRAFASERSVGRSVTFKGESIRVEKVGPEAFKGVDVAFFSAGSAQSREYAPPAVKAGAGRGGQAPRLRVGAQGAPVVAGGNSPAPPRHPGRLGRSH